jgi:aflatoxin B1 aldehyde reductase
MYNLISRKVEEIFPILEDNKMEFWAYNPLAGGLLTAKYLNKNLENNSRFKNNEIYKNIFWKDEILNSLDNFYKNDFYKKNAVEYSYLWLSKYSKLKNNDKIIMGVSDIKQLENNLNIFKNENKIINNDTIKDLNNLYIDIEKYSPNYFY